MLQFFYMLIHFVCQGNTYRSRLADAYCNHKYSPEITATSSGLIASVNENGPISWITALLLRQQNMQESLSSESWKQTTQSMLDSADMIVFMDFAVKEGAEKNFEFTESKIKVLNIHDIVNGHIDSDEGILNIIHEGMKTFENIRNNVDEIYSEVVLQNNA